MELWLLYIAGKTDAERKIEELTRALEEEMEKNEEQGEYFGICHTCKLKVTGAGQACQVCDFKNSVTENNLKFLSFIFIKGNGEFVSYSMLYMLSMWKSLAWKGLL